MKILLSCLLSLSLFVPIYADDYAYEIKDTNSGFSIGFETFEEANKFYGENKDEYDNLVLYEDNNVINMEYGIVEFVGENGIVSYRSTLKDGIDYISGSYGADGAFLYIDGNKVYFKVSGDIGYTNIENVILHPYETLDVSITSYQTKNNYLYHNIKTQLVYENYATSLCIDKMPGFMNNNSTYYSYDGHYFYDNFYTMIDDYRNDSNEFSINSEPYYNYYQYLPYHTYTNYTFEELNDYFEKTLGINGRLIHYNDLNSDNASDEVNRSQFYENINMFFAMEQMYGTNALMLISSAIVESNYGKSLNSYIKNSLYTNNAFESEHEQTNDRYDSIANSIYSYAKYYISKLYSNHIREDYFGTNFGDKISGINIEYSIDHYFGEKCASEYFKLDNALGLKDKGNYSIGVIDELSSLTLYKDAELESKIINLSHPNNLIYVVLDEYDESYKIQIDYSFDNNYLYNVEDCVGYVNKEAFKYITNDELNDYEYEEIEYDFNGGQFYDYDSLDLLVKQNAEPTIIPNKDGYEFVEYTYEDGKYIANYKKISSVSINKLFDKQKELLPYPDLTNAKLLVKYEDGTSSNIAINSDMISTYDPHDSEPQDIVVTYNGISTSKQIQLDTSYYGEFNAITDAIENEDYTYVSDNLGNIRYPLTMSQIRKIDYVLKEKNERNYVIKDASNRYNLSISGLDLSLETKQNFSLIQDTYYVNVDNINYINKQKILNVANGYGFEDVEGLNISFKFNFQKINLNGPAIVQIDLPNKKNDYIYSVYHVNGNGDIIKCRTTQSENFIQFIIDEVGDYEVLCMPSVNKFDIDDNVEDLSYENMGVDNNRVNLEFMLGIATIVIAMIGILIYYQILDAKEKQWKDYKKSLLKVDTVQEEKPKN